MTIRIDEGAETLDVRLAVRAGATRRLVLTAAVAFWAYGEHFAWREWRAAGGGAGEAGEAGFLLFALVVWSLAGLFALRAFLSTVFGTERLLLGGGALAVGRQVFGAGRLRRYPLAAIARLRAEPVPPDLLDLAWGVRVWGTGGAAVVFEAAGRTVRAAPGIEEAEARDLVARLRSRGVDPLSPG
jgi:hypothetical protein